MTIIIQDTPPNGEFNHFDLLPRIDCDEAWEAMLTNPRFAFRHFYEPSIFQKLQATHDVIFVPGESRYYVARR